MAQFLKKYLLWLLFVGFAIMGIITRKDASIFLSNGNYGLGKIIVWVLFFAFLGYTIQCARKENFYKSLKNINQYYWGWQIGIDLYIGLILPLIIIYLNGGALIFLLWIIPVLLNANLFTLLYFALNYDSIVAQFL